MSEDSKLKKHAYLITAYENRHQLEQLLSLLDHERNDVYLQVDSKGSLCVDNLTLNKSSLFILPSFPIYWGRFSMIQAELNLLKAASERRYHYYHMITNSDLPLVSQDKIHNYLENSDLEYVAFEPRDYSWAHWKAAYYHILVESKLYKKCLLIRMFSHFLVKLQILFRIDRLKMSDDILYHGSTYFSVTHGFVEYILSQQTWIEKTFHFALACDEVFIHTLLMKSPFKSKLSSSDSSKTNNLRCIDMKRYNKNSPYTYKMSDFEEQKKLVNEHFLLASLIELSIQKLLIS